MDILHPRENAARRRDEAFPYHGRKRAKLASNDCVTSRAGECLQSIEVLNRPSEPKFKFVNQRRAAGTAASLEPDAIELAEFLEGYARFVRVTIFGVFAIDDRDLHDRLLAFAHKLDRHVVHRIRLRREAHFLIVDDGLMFGDRLDPKRAAIDARMKESLDLAN